MPQRPSLVRECLRCGREFRAQPRDIARGRGRCCSRECAGRIGYAAHLADRRQDGEHNANFKGWSSKRPSVYVRRFRVANPEKVAAQHAVAAAIRSGLLVRPDRCSECDRACRPDAHHEDYSRPLDVVWTCRRCHARLDRARRQRERAELTSAEAARYLRFQSVGEFHAWAEREHIDAANSGLFSLWRRVDLDRAISGTRQQNRSH